MREMRREPLHEEPEVTTADIARGGTAPDARRGTGAPGPARAGNAAEVSRTEPGAVPTRIRPADDRAAALFRPEEAESFRSQWNKIQAGFVDEPRPSVEQADALVASVMKRLAESFAKERERLESQWHGGGDVSTEDLRVALQRYRSFFTRLLSV